MKKLYKIAIPFLIVGMIFVLLPGTANASIAQKNSKNGVNTGFASSVATAAFTNALTNPSLIVVCWEGDGVATWKTANTPTDTAGNVYTLVTDTLSSGTFNSEIWVAENTHTTASDIVTVTDKGAGIDSTVTAEEWTGIVTASPTDKVASTTGVSTALNSGNITPVNSGDLIFGCGAAAISGNHLSLAGSYTNLNQTSTTFTNIGDATQIQAVAAAIAGTLTVSSSVSWNMAVASFIAVAGAATGHVKGYVQKATGYIQKAKGYIQ